MSVSHEEHLDLLIEALDQNKDSLEVASYLIASISLARHPSKNSVDALEKLAGIFLCAKLWRLCETQETFLAANDLKTLLLRHF